MLNVTQFIKYRYLFINMTLNNDKISSWFKELSSGLSVGWSHSVMALFKFNEAQHK